MQAVFQSTVVIYFIFTLDEIFQPTTNVYVYLTIVHEKSNQWRKNVHYKY